MISQETIQSIANEIAERFQPDKIILFGSYAYGTPHEGSDIDLLVIMPLEGRSRDKSLEILKKVRPSVSTDIIVRTPEDTQNRYKLYDPLIREALDKGILLYERSSRRMAS